MSARGKLFNLIAALLLLQPFALLRMAALVSAEVESWGE